MCFPDWPAKEVLALGGSLLSRNLSSLAVLALMLEPLSIILLTFLFSFKLIQASFLVILGSGRVASPSAVHLQAAMVKRSSCPESRVLCSAGLKS